MHNLIDYYLIDVLSSLKHMGINIMYVFDGYTSNVNKLFSKMITNNLHSPNTEPPRLYFKDLAPLTFSILRNQLSNEKNKFPVHVLSRTASFSWV